MAPLRFSANLSWLFPELPGLLARLQAAGSSGFEAAEVAWPYAEPPEALARAAQEAGLRLVLINTPPGDQEKGEMGLGAVPGRQAAFREGLEQAVRYAKALGCPRRTSWDCWSPSTPESLTPSTSWTRPSRRQPSYRRWEDPTSNYKWPWQEPRPHICPHLSPGHVQVAQVPGRGEPSSPGELNFPYLFQLLEDEGYKGFVGCEYRPQGDTVEGLSWLRSYWDRRGHPEAGQ
ncbi:putative hydroxypyruvate isomerase isoform X4 [Saimiri boliviensis]|uniref:putative hydroxypyruvate isomerase isoform X4 n=1 Tax=Saimiri boliviensis TaxID=27679 RepID=UPI000533E58A|nr:putative hydroxypyruvate isomerase isoform X4 [Saimiri boliviensis boliviensis]